MADGADKATLSRLRRRIDKIDQELLGLLQERHEAARQVAVLKRNTGRDRYIPSREKQILKKILSINAGKLPPAAVEGIYRDILGLCRQSEKPLVVAFPGPEGSVTHAAGRAQFGFSTRLIAVPGISAVLEEVASQRADYGIVPLETSTEGIGAHALEYFLESDLKISAEFYWKLNLTVAGTRRPGKRKPARLFVQELLYAMNRPWISEAFPGVEVEQLPSVAWAAREALKAPGTLALCPRFTAESYGLEVLAEAPGNVLAKELRFLTAGRGIPETTRSDKTTVAFTLVDRVGVLDEALRLFKRRKVNLSLLESYYPSKTLPTVTFFADFVGHSSDRRIQQLLEDLRKLTSFVKVLGSYPVFRS